MLNIEMSVASFVLSSLPFSSCRNLMNKSSSTGDLHNLGLVQFFRILARGWSCVLNYIDKDAFHIAAPKRRSSRITVSKHQRPRSFHTANFAGDRCLHGHFLSVCCAYSCAVHPVRIRSTSSASVAFTSVTGTSSVIPWPRLHDTSRNHRSSSLSEIIPNLRPTHFTERVTSSCTRLNDMARSAMPNNR